MLSCKLQQLEHEAAGLQAQSNVTRREFWVYMEQHQAEGATAAAKSAAGAEQCQILRREMAHNSSVHTSEVEVLKMKFGHAEGMLHRESGTVARLHDGVITTRTELNAMRQE